MARPKELEGETQKLTITLTLEDYSWLERYAILRGESKSEIVRKSIKYYKQYLLEKARKKKEEAEKQGKVLEPQKRVVQEKVKDPNKGTLKKIKKL